MFQFTRFASQPYVFRLRYPCGWVSPFRNLRINAYLPAPRSLSQAITSFVAYHRQGIHHMLLVTWPYNFDISFEMTQSSDRRLVLWGLTPHALCRKYEWSFSCNPFLDHCFENDSSLLEFKQSSNSFWRNQNFVIKGTVALACISSDNTDFDSMNC